MRRSSGLGAAVCALVFLFVCAPSAGAATFVVNTTADSDPDGCTTAAGGCTLREAITDANAAGGDDSVTLPAGHYKLTNPQGGSLVIDDVDKGNLELNGAGAETTIVDAEGRSGVFEVWFGSGFDASGVTITGAFGCACFPGSGVYAEPETSVTLTDSVVTKNTGFAGGGIGSTGGEVTLTRTEVDHNVAILGGGGVSVSGGDLAVEDSYVHSNHTFGAGGGIYSSALEACDEGSGSDLTSECPYGGGGGGGLTSLGDPNEFPVGGVLNVESSTVSDNTSDVDGGGIYFYGATEEGETSSLALKGSGPTGTTPPGVLLNSTVSGNVSLDGRGAGVAVDGGSFDLASATVAGNQSFDSGGDGVGGGGVYSGGSVENGEEIHFKNTIMSGNRYAGAVQNCAVLDASVLVDDEGNFEDADTCDFAVGRFGVDPKLKPLADNGGPAPTHALRDQSPAIDTGVNDGAPELDQRGGDRPPAGGSAGDTVDSGAYEAYSLADLAVEAKADGPDPANVGGRLTYTIVVRNNGPDAVNGVTAADAVPAAVTRSAVGGVTGGGTCSTTFVCEWQRVDSGQVLTATLHTTPIATGIATNSATIGALGITDPEPANNSASAATLINPAGTLPPSGAPPAERELDDSISVDLNAPKTVTLDTFFKGITVTSSCTGELCIRKFREHASINTGATSIAGFNLTVSRTSLGYTAKKKVRLRPCLSGSTTGRRHRRCMKNLRKAAEKAAPFRVKIVVEAVDRAGNRDAKKVFLRVTP